MRGIAAHPSRRAHARPDLRQHFRTRAPQDEAAQGIPSPRLVVEPSSVIPISRCQTAHRVPAAHVCVRGLRFRFTHPQRGWAERRQTFGCSAEHPLGVHVTRHARRLRGALRPITRDARLSALHRGGFSPGAALPSPAFAPDRLQRAPRSQVVVPGGRLPGPPGANGYKPPPRDATPRSAFRIVSRTRPQ